MKGGFYEFNFAQTGARYSTTFCTFAGLSSDTKPVGVYQGIGIANGSEFIEMDTGATYLYNAEDQLWVERGD